MHFVGIVGGVEVDQNVQDVLESGDADWLHPVDAPPETVPDPDSRPLHDGPLLAFGDVGVQKRRLEPYPVLGVQLLPLIVGHRHGHHRVLAAHGAAVQVVWDTVEQVVDDYLGHQRQVAAQTPDEVPVPAQVGQQCLEGQLLEDIRVVHVPVNHPLVAVDTFQVHHVASGPVIEQ